MVKDRRERGDWKKADDSGKTEDIKSRGLELSAHGVSADGGFGPFRSMEVSSRKYRFVKNVEKFLWLLVCAFRLLRGEALFVKASR